MLPCPLGKALYSVLVHRVSDLPPASFPRVFTPQLPLACSSARNGLLGDFNPICSESCPAYRKNQGRKTDPGFA